MLLKQDGDIQNAYADISGMINNISYRTDIKFEDEIKILDEVI